MPLKRGLEREACDFCYRRKVRCDRSLRATQGHATCSQCAVREEQCRLDDSDDIRIQRRRGFSARGSSTDTCARESEPGPVNTLLEHRGISTSSLASELQFESLPPGDVNLAPSKYADDLFVDDTFGLSLDNIFFLDQVFMGDSEPAEWNSTLQIANAQDPSSTTEEDQSNTQEQHEQVSVFSAESLDQSSWQGGLADPTTLTAALHSYFNFAASFLSIILEDAFWQDYHAGRCSQALVYAIACRGLPFTAATNQWHFQQRVARQFREAFLQTRSTASDDRMIRLDDLEALALMIGFEYDDAGSPTLHSSLGNLFLKHESLVLMTLQSRICDRSSTSSDPSAMLARAGERRALLYWHVYALDAFHCLDRKQISYIPDDDAGRYEILPQHEAKSYFDAILALAIMARKTVQTLCSTAAKRLGVESSDVHVLYEQLYHWRNHICPKDLRRSEENAGKVAKMDLRGANDSVSKKHIQLQLHRSVLWALEIDYLMQIEDCVSQYGIHDSTSLKAEATALRVEHESVRALMDMIAICQWMEQHKIRDQDDKPHSLIDLAPTPLRNVCTGTCFWSCQRGIEFCRRPPPILLHICSTRDLTSRRCAGSDNLRRHVNTYAETARLLRDAAATATSHHDTARVLERLDKQRALLETKLGDIQTINE